MYVEASSPFEASNVTGQTGLTGTIQVKVIDNDGVDVIGPTALNIAEDGVSGVYIWNAPAAPAALGQYTIIWSTDGTFDDITTSAEDLVVVEASAGPLPPIPPPDEGGPGFGPCTAWTTSEDVADCCSVETSTDTIFDTVVDGASQLLFELSGRQFSGLCSVEGYRPYCDQCWCGYQILSRGHIIGPWDWGYPLWNYCDQCLVSCSPSLVKLKGYPIREITEVKIDGAVVAGTEYVLWNSRYLKRLDDARWPWTQDLTLASTEDNTFSVSYTYGQSPPVVGQMAASQLACELYKECAGSTCALPKGTTRITRQGITIDRLAFTTWAFQNGGWRTGLPLVDAFLQAYNPSGLKRRPIFYAPGRRQYAQEFGT